MVGIVLAYVWQLFRVVTDWEQLAILLVCGDLDAQGFRPLVVRPVIGFGEKEGV